VIFFCAGCWECLARRLFSAGLRAKHWFRVWVQRDTLRTLAAGLHLGGGRIDPLPPFHHRIDLTVHPRPRRCPGRLCPGPLCGQGPWGQVLTLYDPLKVESTIDLTLSARPLSFFIFSASRRSATDTAEYDDPNAFPISPSESPPGRRDNAIPMIRGNPSPRRPRPSFSRASGVVLYPSATHSVISSTVNCF
jgi:hypothetical protein